jgi:redox-sensitive bicupin YhaK (pirin superfamily)
MSDLDAGEKIAFHQEEDRRTYVFVIEGDLTLNKDSKLNRRDAARITDITELDIQSEEGASFMLIDLP